jgi:GT2 family glycosyltransferase
MDMRVLVVIVTYNALRHDWIKKCLQSIEQSSIIPDVFIVDNNSTDETRSYIKAQSRHYILHESDQNLGFGKANNLGLEYALKYNYDYVFLINQDVYLERNTIETLLKLDYESYGIISPLQCDGQGNKIDEDFLEFLGPGRCKDFLSDGILGNFKDKIYPCEFVMGAAWFMPISTVKKIGGFSKFFFQYGEDENYSHRVLHSGLKIGIYPKAKIYHERYKYQPTFFDRIDGKFRHHLIRILNPLIKFYKFRSKTIVLLYYFFSGRIEDRLVYAKIYHFLKKKNNS